MEKQRLYKVLEHMFFTNSITIIENITHDEAIRISNEEMPDIYTWRTVEKQ